MDTEEDPVRESLRSNEFCTADEMRKNRAANDHSFSQLNARAAQKYPEQYRVARERYAVPEGY